MNNRKNFKLKLMALLLAATTVGAALLSCSGSDGSEDTTKKDSQTTSPTTEKEYLEVKIPEFDFLGTDLSKYVTLPSDLFTRDYKAGFTLLGTPDEDDVEEEIKKRLKKLSEEKDAAQSDVVEDGDTVVMDFVGKLDGDAFSGGTAQDYKHDVSVKNSTFIPGYDEGLLGMSAGETKDLHLTFPDPYLSNPALAGKAVVFTVTVDKIIKYEIPELTDEFISDNVDFFGKDIKTAAEYKQLVKKELTESYKEKDGKTEASIIAVAWKYAIENSEYKAYPETYLEEYIEAIYNTEYNNAIYNSITFEQYVINKGYLTVEDYKKAVVTETAKKYINEFLVLWQACKQVGISVSEEEARAEVEKVYKSDVEPILYLYSQQLGVNSLDDYIEYLGGITSIRQNVMYNRLVYEIADLQMPDSDEET